MDDSWWLKRAGSSSDRDSVTRQTLQVGIRVPPPKKPYPDIEPWENSALTGVALVWPVVCHLRAWRVLTDRRALCAPLLAYACVLTGLLAVVLAGLFPWQPLPPCAGPEACP